MTVNLVIPDDVLDAIALKVIERLASTDPWLSPALAADYIGCSKQRIYDLIASGAIAVGKDGRRVLIRRSELDRYLQPQEAPQ